MSPPQPSLCYWPQGLASRLHLFCIHTLCHVTLQILPALGGEQCPALDVGLGRQVSADGTQTVVCETGHTLLCLCRGKDMPQLACWSWEDEACGTVWNTAQPLLAKISQAPEDLQCSNKKHMLDGVLLRFRVVWCPLIADRHTTPHSSPSWKPTQEEAFWEKEPSREILSQETIPHLCDPC